MSKSDVVEIEGTVVEKLPNAIHGYAAFNLMTGFPALFP